MDTDIGATADVTFSNQSRTIWGAWVQIISPLTHARSWPTRRHHRSGQIMSACGSGPPAKDAKLLRYLLSRSGSSLLLRSTWRLGPQGPWLIDLIYRACACMPTHNSPAWRNIVLFQPGCLAQGCSAAATEEPGRRQLILHTCQICIYSIMFAFLIIHTEYGDSQGLNRRIPGYMLPPVHQ